MYLSKMATICDFTIAMLIPSFDSLHLAHSPKPRPVAQTINGPQNYYTTNQVTVDI